MKIFNWMSSKNEQNQSDSAVNDMSKEYKILNLTVIVAALGYFVDTYDIVLFAVVRVASLQGIGVPAEEVLDTGLFLINMQMAGMLVGGIFWGIWADKRGRRSVLFLSILIYSIANILNAFVDSVPMYAALRLLAGFGLAGEIGAAITLVSEIMPKEKRGYSTAIIATVGVAGAGAAALTAGMFSWQTAYLVGGGMGLALLVLRMGVLESDLFEKTVKNAKSNAGDLRILFTSWNRFSRYMACIMVGVPFYYVVNVLFYIAPEVTQALGAAVPISAGSAILAGTIGMVVGDMSSGFLSQYIKSRKKVIGLFLTCMSVMALIYLLSPQGMGEVYFYGLYTIIGFFGGYWAVLLVTSAEQFGTNIRATVTTTVPNFIRASTIFINGLLLFLKTHFDIIPSILILGVICLSIGAIGLWRLQETYAKDLDYIEE